VTMPHSQVWYHGTFAPPPEGQSWHPFTHLGTREAAIEMLTDRYCLDNIRGTPTLFTFQVPANLNLLSVPDFDSPDPAVWVSRLRNDQRFFPSPNGAIELMRKLRGAPETRPTRLAHFGRWLTGFGYDGYSYVNDHEDVGSISIAVANSSHLCQIASIGVDMAELRRCFDAIKHKPKYANSDRPTLPTR